jgi:ABC-type lipoprotein export system ATPase subunit
MGFLRGSEWHKWDLHIHTPGTKKNDQYRYTGADPLDRFCDVIEQADVQAFGIADYFSADAYFSLLDRFKEKYPNSKKLFVPNIELCTSDVVNNASEEVNLHILFNPNVPNLQVNIRSFLSHLKTNKTDGSNRHIKTLELESRRDFEEATTTRAFIKTAFNETFGDKADWSDYLLIFTAANNDGLRSMRGVKRKAVITDEVDKFSHGFFGNSGNRDHFLRTDRLEEPSQKIDPKPVISGSDSHSFDQLQDWLGKLVIENGVTIKEPTWIKAELTFEGLKQILYEPRGRVFIGEEPEVEVNARNKKRKYIESISLDSVSGYSGRCGRWFSDQRISLNKELVAIIGNKGSGKSALTDTLGLLGNSHNQKYTINGKSEELFSFLNAEKFLKGRCATNFVGELHWYAGEPDRRTLDAITDDKSQENVEYLPQKYLEKICSNIEDDEFRYKLNAVIFEYVEKNSRYDQSNLDDLIKYLSNQTELDISHLKQALHEENEKVIAFERKLSENYASEIEDRIRRLEAEIAAHIEVRPIAVERPPESDQTTITGAKEIADIESELQTLHEQIEVVKTEQAITAKQVEDLSQAKRAIEREVEVFQELGTEYHALFHSVGLSFDQIISVSVKFRDLDRILETKNERLRQIEQLVREVEEIEFFEIDEATRNEALSTSLLSRSALLERNKAELIEKLDQPNREYQDYLKKEADWQSQQLTLIGDPEHPAPDSLRWLQTELGAIRRVYPVELRATITERNRISSEILSKRKSMVVFYNDVKHSIDKEIEKHSDDLGDYEISIEAGLRFDTVFYEEFFGSISQAVKGSFQNKEPGRARLKEILADVSSWENETEVFTALEVIMENLHIDKTSGDVVRTIFAQMKQKREPVDLYDYLFGFDYLQTKYDLKVDGKDLSELSPGERGGLLLIFYLMLDRRDIPLIIDQPEDNLDNKSIYEMLVTFLKKAKKRRQIIMATHNPNLAVVADAEQIIHVSIDKKNDNTFHFYTGGIEDAEINRRAVDILEGTLPAFDNRRLKYRRQ